MKAPARDEIIEEIRRHRHAHAESLDFDLAKITKDFQRQQEEAGAATVRRPPRKPRTVSKRTA
jgi:hypothetical protein